MAFLVATTSLPAVYRPNGYARTTTAGTPHARAKNINWPYIFEQWLRLGRYLCREKWIIKSACPRKAFSPKSSNCQNLQFSIKSFKKTSSYNILQTIIVCFISEQKHNRAYTTTTTMIPYKIEVIWGQTPLISLLLLLLFQCCLYSSQYSCFYSSPRLSSNHFIPKRRHSEKVVLEILLWLS